MKRTKLLLSAVVALLLSVVMVFTLAACNKKKNNDSGKNETPDKSASDLGITTPEDEDQTLALLSLSVVEDSYIDEFELNEEFDKGGLIVRATYLDPSIEVTDTEPDANLKVETLTESQYVLDSSDYVASRVGIYTIYISHTYAGVTRVTSYDVTVNGADPAYGGIVVKAADGADTEYRITADSKSVTIDPEEIVEVYKIDTEEGEPEEEPLEATEYTAQLYLGAEEVKDNVATKNGVYSLVVTLNSDKNAQDFISVYIANEVVGLTFLEDEEGTVLEQNRGVVDTISSTWQFEVEYINGVKKAVTAADQGINYTFNPMNTGKQEVTVTYTETDALGDKHTTTSATVEANVIANTEVLALEYEYVSDGTTKPVVGQPLVKGDSTVISNTDGGTLNASDNRTFSDGKSFSGRIQLKGDSRYITLNLYGPAKITAYFRSGSTNVLRTMQLRQGSSPTGTILATHSNYDKELTPAVFVTPAPAAGADTATYTITSDDSINFYAIYITTLVPVPGQEIDTFDITYHENYGETETVTTDKVFDYPGMDVINGYTPARDGWTFDGWYTAAEDGKKVDMPYTVTEDIELYAHWTAIPVEEIAVEKTKTDYVLTNENITIGASEFKDITITNADGSAMAAEWSYSYKVYSDSDCKNEVANGIIAEVGTYYIKVTATYGGDEKFDDVSKAVAIEVVKPTSISVKPNKIDMALDEDDTLTLTKADLEALSIKSDGGEELGSVWTVTYSVVDEDDKAITGTNSWELTAEGSYTVTITAKKDNTNIELTATVTVVVWPYGTELTKDFEITADELFAAHGASVAAGSELKEDTGVYVTSALDIDANSKSLNDKSFSYRLKLGGAGDITQRNLRFDDLKPGAKITIYGITSSSNDTSRTLSLYDSDGALVEGSTTAGFPNALTEVTFNITSYGTFYIWGSGAVNVYYIAVSYGA